MDESQHAAAQRTGPQVVVILEGRRYRVPQQGLRIGRAPENDIVLPDVNVAAQHVTIWATPDGVFLRDLKGPGGTYLNSHRVGDGAVAISHGATVRVGTTDLQVEIAWVGGPAIQHSPGAHGGGARLNVSVGRLMVGGIAAVLIVVMLGAGMLVLYTGADTSTQATPKAAQVTTPPVAAPTTAASPVAAPTTTAPPVAAPTTPTSPVAASPLAASPVASPAGDEEAAGALMTVLRGEVVVLRPNGTAIQPAVSGMIVHDGDEIRTLSSTGALITFEVGTEIEMGDDTIIVIERVVRQGERIDISLHQINGVSLHHIASFRTPGSAYRLETGGAITEVHGTEFVLLGPLPNGVVIIVCSVDCDPSSTFVNRPLGPNVGYWAVVDKGQVVREPAAFNPDFSGGIWKAAFEGASLAQQTLRGENSPSTPTPTPTLSLSPAPPTTTTTTTPTPPSTLAPALVPTQTLTLAPTQTPTLAPTLAPTPAPTLAPTLAPTPAPTQAPTLAPTPPPTQGPEIDPYYTPETALYYPYEYDTIQTRRMTSQVHTWRGVSRV